MKSTRATAAAVFGLLFRVSWAAASSGRPCLDYPTKASALKTCSTASDFCSSYLGPSHTPIPITHTHTTTVVVPHSKTVLHTYTVTKGTSFTGTTTVTPSTTVTKTITPPKVSLLPIDKAYFNSTVGACAGSANNRLLRRQDDLQSASCGLRPSAKKSQVSGACSCILASTELTTKTITKHGPHTKTITKTHTFSPTITTESTATADTTSTTTSTILACATTCPDSFYLLFSGTGTSADGTYGIVPDVERKGFTDVHAGTATSTDIASLFSLTSSGNLFVIEPGYGVEYANGYEYGAATSASRLYFGGSSLYTSRAACSLESAFTCTSTGLKSDFFIISTAADLTSDSTAAGPWQLFMGRQHVAETYGMMPIPVDLIAVCS